MNPPNKKVAAGAKGKAKAHAKEEQKKAKVAKAQPKGTLKAILSSLKGTESYIVKTAASLYGLR